MKNKIYPSKIAHIICAFVLLFCFVFISLAQAYHQHENHTHYNKDTNGHFEQKFAKKSTKACQICQFILNTNQAKILTATRYFNFIPFKNIEILHVDKYVVFYRSKPLSLFSGSSPPTT